MLIEGDNYHGLLALAHAKVKVDIIYIDPPYNTGNKDFIYNDDFTNDPTPVGHDDPHRHSKWISFMKKRLELAKELLSEEGVIFVSIDDNEQAYLKVLMDEIFGETNFICNFDWISKPGGQSDNKYVSTVKQYILMYSKTLFFKTSKKYIDIDEKHVYGIDEKGTYLKSTELNSPAGEDGKYAWQRINLSFHISYNPKTQDLIFDPSWDLKNNKPILPIIRNGYYIASPKKSNLCWRWGEQSFRNNFDDLIIETNINGTMRIFKKQYVKNLKKETYIKDNLILNITQASGTKELKSIFANSVFDYPKPTKLIKELISLHFSNNALILDFFAGTGTTGQAAMELNEEDAGNRRFILMTNNESKTRSEQEAKDGQDHPELGICRAVTRERLYRVIHGKGSQNEKIKWIYKKEQLSLQNNAVRYLQVDYVHKITGEFEEIDKNKSLYKVEFDRNLSILDLK